MADGATVMAGRRTGEGIGHDALLANPTAPHLPSL